MTDRTEAAAARAAGVAQRSHRPSQRRAAESAPPVRPGASFRSRLSISRTPALDPESPAEDAGEDPGADAVLRFDGYATVYEQPYEMWDYFGPYQEVVSVGAAAETLANPDLDCPLVLGHDQLRRIARTTNGTLGLTDDATGLRVRAVLDPEDEDVDYIAPKIAAGLVDEMSFCFRITAGSWSPDYAEYRIDRFDLHRGDVAIVGYGANPATSAGLRSARTAADARVRLALATAL